MKTRTEIKYVRISFDFIKMGKRSVVEFKLGQDKLQSNNLQNPLD